MYFAMNLIIVTGMFVCSSSFISVCMFIVSKALLISGATVIFRARGAIWLNPFATVLVSVSSAYLCELISRRESSVNTRLGADHHQLSMPPISKDCSNTFLERSYIYAAPCEWNKLNECIRTSTFDSFRKSVKTMLFTQQYGC